jgi:hypothetical protein
MASKNYKPTSTGNGKFFWQHFERVDTDDDGAIDASQFYTAIQNIMNDKSIKGTKIEFKACFMFVHELFSHERCFEMINRRFQEQSTAKVG